MEARDRLGGRVMARKATKATLSTPTAGRSRGRWKRLALARRTRLRIRAVCSIWARMKGCWETSASLGRRCTKSQALTSACPHGKSEDLVLKILTLFQGDCLLTRDLYQVAAQGLGGGPIVTALKPKQRPPFVQSIAFQ